MNYTEHANVTNIFDSCGHHICLPELVFLYIYLTLYSLDESGTVSTVLHQIILSMNKSWCLGGFNLFSDVKTKFHVYDRLL